MGIFIDALSIVSASFFGSVFKKRIKFSNFAALGIGIMIISIVGFIENIFNIEAMALKSDDLLVVVFSLIIGIALGEAMQLETKINNMSSLGKKGFSEFIDASIFFGVGGMQICGPLMLATMGDNSQLLLKSIIDFPFALMFGITYGKKVALSAVPVAFGQLIILILAFLSKDILNTTVIKQLCAMGYIILFFSGFNLIRENKNKINNVNMIIGIFIIILYNIIANIFVA